MRSVPSSPSRATTRFTVADFNRLGKHSGFSYRLPHMPVAGRDAPVTCIAEGRVEEFSLRQGLSLVVSDLHVHEHYEATSMLSPRFSVIVMLQGNARAQVDDEGVSMVAHSGVSALYGDVAAMTGVHPGGQRIRSVNLSLADPHAVDDDRIRELLKQAMARPRHGLRRWRVDGYLIQAIEHLLENPWAPAMQEMLRENVGALLLTHALASLTEAAPEQESLSTRDRQLLERVRERLDRAPGDTHKLEDLARLACMSPSTLRAKFQAAYQVSVFGWLRARRLALAREQLAQGASVQQVAHLAGYKHATNFATAFRERYGVAPSELS